MDRKNMTLVCLLASSFVLLTLLTLVHLFASPQVVIAGGMLDRGGDYVATVSRTSSDEEVLWVLDCKNKTAVIYQYDNSSRMLELRTTLTIKELGQ